MNAKRRKDLKAIITRLELLEQLRQEIRDELYEVLDQEQEALDNLPESLQESERGQQMQEYIEAMENVHDELDCMEIEELTDQLREIVEV